MNYKSLDQLSEDELVESFDINFTSVYELEQELRHYGRREAELLRKAINYTKRFNKMLGNLKITEAQLISKIKSRAVAEGKPIAPSAFGEIRKSMVADEKEWQEAHKSLIKAQADSELWNGLLSAWRSRGFRLQELAKIAERTLWGEMTISEKSNDIDNLGYDNNSSKFRSVEQQLESKSQDAFKGLELDY